MSKNFVFYDWNNRLWIEAKRLRGRQYQLAFERILILLGPNEIAIIGDAVQVGQQRLHGRLQQNEMQLMQSAAGLIRLTAIIADFHYDAAIVKEVHLANKFVYIIFLFRSKIIIFK